MTYISCSVSERFVNPLFEVFDGGDFILSSYRDIEEPFARMRIFFEDAAQTDAAKSALKSALDIVGIDAPIEVGEIADDDWKLAYRRHFKTEPIGERLLTVPAWEVEEAKEKWGDSGRQMIVLDPGMAFGTGKHETTKACLEYIDEVLAGEVSVTAPVAPRIAPATQLASLGGYEDGDGTVSFLDMGCGSGILSIAAAKLGCTTVKGFDVDQEAVDASIENAAANGVNVEFVKFALGREPYRRASSPTASPSQPPASAAFGCVASLGCSGGDAPRYGVRHYGLVAANILGPLLIRFVDEIAEYVGDKLILSGILTTLYPEVKATYEAKGFREISNKTFGEWTTGLYSR